MIALERKPTKKQLELAKKLKIDGAENLSRQELAFAIEQALKEKKEVREDVGKNLERDDLIDIYEYPAHTNIQKQIVITIPKKENQETFKMLKKKKLYKNSPSLMAQFIEFLVKVGAEDKKKYIEITTGNNDDVYSPSYIRSVLDSFFISYSWEYAE